ncbi:MAG: putative transport system ATP-binding protein [Peptococcaceae bacterium]|nr:putative transport system ATP-binding protein [Peptococcaceae bacterium]
MLKMSNISKIYQTGAVEVIALNKINLTVEEGEFVAIVGPSGSGKSTLMNLIGCLDIPTQGEYWLDGQEVSKLSDDELADIRNLKIGFIFQGFNLLHKLSALENVELPLIYRGMNAKERQERALRALAKVGLEHRLHHKPSELSGGQQQRVAIARALAGDPPLILADEPTGNLDSVSGKEVLASLQELNQQGHTIILITHDTQVAERARRIIRIQDGSIVSDERMG